MIKPRYDAERNESRHSAAKAGDCPKMAKKYGWELKDVEPLQGELLKADCVFEGDTEFPRPYQETETED